MAADAIDGVVDLIMRNVKKGEKVTISGFGVFEKRARAARNPRTGEQVRVKRATVPAFRAGTAFKEVMDGTRKMPTMASGMSAVAAAKPAASKSKSRSSSAKSKSTAKRATARPAAKT